MKGFERREKSHESCGQMERERLEGRECRRQERDHSLQMKRTCEDERDLCDLHTCDWLKVTTQTRPVVIPMCLCLVKNMKNDGGCVLAYDLVYATQSFWGFFWGGGGGQC